MLDLRRLYILAFFHFPLGFGRKDIDVSNKSDSTRPARNFFHQIISNVEFCHFRKWLDEDLMRDGLQRMSKAGKDEAAIKVAQSLACGLPGADRRNARYDGNRLQPAGTPVCAVANVPFVYRPC